jgi:hypothetical protein
MRDDFDDPLEDSRNIWNESSTGYTRIALAF